MTASYVPCKSVKNSVFYVFCLFICLFVFFQISTSVLQVISVTAVQPVIIQVDRTLASVIAVIQGMDEPVKVN